MKLDRGFADGDKGLSSKDSEGKPGRKESRFRAERDHRYTLKNGSY